MLFNHSGQPFAVKTGDRVAQLILEKVLVIDPEQGPISGTTARGSGGFGSTGAGSKKPKPDGEAVATIATLQDVQAAIAPVDAVFADTWEYFEALEAKAAQQHVAGHVKAAAALQKIDRALRPTPKLSGHRKLIKIGFMGF